MKAVDHKCPSCNANIDYNPKLKKWKCDYCGSSFTLKELEINEEKFKQESISKSKELKKNKKEEIEQEYDEYQCNNCGAKIVANPNTAATFCIYCKNTAILKSRLADQFTPSRIIPFNLIKNDAIEAFKKVGKKKFLMPKEFSDSKNIQELTGIYIPFWLYSCKIDSSFEANADRITTWKMGDYLYTKTDTYKITRNSEFEYNLIPFDGSVRFNDAIMNSIEPFNYKELVDFSSSYLSGFLAEKYDVMEEDAKKVAFERAKNTSSSIIKSVPGYSIVRPINEENVVKEEEIEYVLFPVWMVNIKYKEKFYTFAMNGQTGKMIGDIPYSKIKLLFFILAVFIIIFSVVALLTYYI